jgi:hypothetical protein
MTFTNTILNRYRFIISTRDANMPRLVEPVIPDPGDLDAQVEFFIANSFVILPALFSENEVAELNNAIDHDRKNNPFMWYCTTSRDYNCNLLLTQPIFEKMIRHPRILPLVERLMGGPCCFEELAVRHKSAELESRDTDWHRDRDYWREHPLHLDYPQVIYYLTDVDETTHCFSISPEPADGEIINDKTRHIERGGILHFYGKAGSAILFNAATVHGVTTRKTNRIRRTVQVYYGHPHRPSLSEVSAIPPRLWRDHPDPETKRFYGKLNRYTKIMMQGMGIADFGL